MSVQALLDIINVAITRCSNWFTTILQSCGAVDMYISCLFIVLVLRFIVFPIIGPGSLTRSSGSDTARKKDSDNG